MRFPDNIQFYSNVKEHYDPKVGDYVGGPELVGEEIANITETGTETSVQDFGEIATKNLVIRLVNDVNYKWSYLTVNGLEQKYKPITTRKPLKNNTLIVGEMNE
ncbi:hypothetical protein D0502_10705 [Leuconostoc falkenbergense]|uniref:Phage protein n=1 Tax=Leuconostoc falkenbergense TaxID=2766470 RepID=A0A9X3E9P0_9LACO|nr:hypothetical protein [Leuconostoc falkenbergense]MCX7579841.1 hypothetical protein [Leuconostoc falkenbergense]